MNGDDASSIGQSSAAVAMANDAIDNARRAAASSRSRRAAAERAALSSSPDPIADVLSGSSSRRNRLGIVPPRGPLWSGEGGEDGGGANAGGGQDVDLKHNDGAYHVVATLVTERLLPKIDGAPAGTTYYTLTAEDVAFFQRMLPYQVRRGFVDALRYRSQLLKSGVGDKNGPTGRLTMSCQMLGLDRAIATITCSNGAGPFQYPINYKNQGPVAVPKEYPSQSYDQRDDNAVNFGLNSPMAYSPTASGHDRNAPTGGDSPFHDPSYAPFGSRTGTTDWETSGAESLARQQIMAEINETKFLMRGSVTPDAVNFWKKHLEELNQRLVALSLEEQLRAAGSGVGAAGSGAPSVRFGSGADAGSRDHDYDAYYKMNVEDKLRSRGDAGGGGVVAADGSFRPAGEPPTMAGGATPPPPPHKRPLDELPVCDVVAPSDLPGGYMFEAQLGSKKFLATVPPGGVSKGQRFASTMRELETIEIPVPLGGWRDGVSECCNDGVLHPLFLNTLCFPCIALGQIMTRNGLDFQGEPANKLISGLSCANMTVLLTFWIAMNISAAIMLRVAWQRGRLLGDENYLAIAAFNLVVLLYMINLTRKVRESIRNKYQIPEETCIGLEDCLCATCCMPCAICQMGRHTADFDTYRATCCTRTGLPRQVELAPVTFYEDQYQNMNEETEGQVI
ncbi:hypothetical protein ACHAWF_015470 [Thalassiosira exigua]